jgi:hypothetical protein
MALLRAHGVLVDIDQPKVRFSGFVAGAAVQNFAQGAIETHIGNDYRFPCSACWIGCR